MMILIGVESEARMVNGHEFMAWHGYDTPRAK
jgi:hypothetical protein